MSQGPSQGQARRMRAALFALVLLGATAGCDDGAAVEGLVQDNNTDDPIAEVAVGFLQVQGGRLELRADFSATTDTDGTWGMATQSGPFPEGFFTFSHELYISDTVHFFGAELGATGQVNLFMIPLDESTATGPPQPHIR